MKVKQILREHFALSRRAWLAKAAALAGFVLLSVFLVYTFGQLYDRPAPGEYLEAQQLEQTTPAVSEGDVLSQSFISPFDTLRVLALAPQSAQASVNVMYVVRVYENGELLFTSDFKTQDVVGSHNLCEVPLTDAKGKEYRVEVTLGRTTEGQAVPFGMMPPQEGFEPAQYNGKALDGALWLKLNTADTGQASTYTVLLVLLAVALLAVVALLGRNAIINTVVLICAFGCFMAVLNPVGDSPDEFAHYLRAETLAQGRIFTASDVPVEVDKGLYDLFAYGSTEEQTYYRFSDAHIYAIRAGEQTVQAVSGTAANYIFVSYLGSALGLLLGKALGLPAILVVYLCRMGNVLVYAALCAAALWLLPKLKTTFAFLMCFPMCVYMAASFNSDLTTYALAFLLAAYLLRLWCAPDGSAGLPQLAIYCVLALLLALTKIPYVAFIPLILLVPRARWRTKRHLWYVLGGIAVVALLCLVWLALSGAAGLRVATGASTGGQLAYLLAHPWRGVNTILGTFFAEWTLLYQHWFTLGWLSYNFAYLGMVVPFVLYHFVSCEALEPQQVLGRGQKAYVAVCGVGAVLLTYLAMYISTNPVGAAAVVGIQGRYLLPCVVLLPLLLAKPRREARGASALSAALWNTGFLTVCVSTMLLRHYL